MANWLVTPHLVVQPEICNYFFIAVTKRSVEWFREEMPFCVETFFYAGYKYSKYVGIGFYILRIKIRFNVRGI
jgi:hypothetical protein